MNTNEFAKNKTDELVNDLKQKMLKAGIPMTQRDEDFFRMGMSHGITLSAFILGNMPVDITLENGEKKNENKLPTKDEYVSSTVSSIDVGISTEKYSEPRFKCPKCGGGMRKNLQEICTSLPPKYEYRCDTCGLVTFLNN